jgi:hypothetical protein
MRKAIPSKIRTKKNDKHPAANKSMLKIAVNAVAEHDLSGPIPPQVGKLVV